MLELALESNGYHLAVTPERLGWLTPSQPHAPIEHLREQFRAQGYLWLKGLLDRELVLDFRRRYFTAMQSTGLVDSAADPVEGLYAGQAVNHQRVGQIEQEVVRWAAYESLCLAAPIWQFYERLLGGAVHLLKRKLIRHTTRESAGATGAHYDLVYLREGTDQVCTSWLPLGDVPVEMGGLVYLENSDQFGRQAEAEFRVKNASLTPEEQINAFNKNMGENGWLSKDLPMLADRLNSRWLIANYEAGDMVIHSAYIIHAAIRNQAAQIRLSTDIRYQLISEKIDERWGNHHRYDDKL